MVATAGVLSGCLLSEENTVPGKLKTAALDSLQVES